MTIKENASASSPNDEALQSSVGRNSSPEANFNEPASYENEIPFVEAIPVSDDGPPTAPKPASSLQNGVSSITTEQQQHQQNEAPQLSMMTTGQGTTIPANARWVKVRHVGGATWSICTIVSVFSCLMMCLPCGVWAFLCPCDEIRAYEVDGQVYDEHGRPLGNVSKLRISR